MKLLTTPAILLLLLSLLITSCDEDPITRQYLSDDGVHMTVSGVFEGNHFEKELVLQLYDQYGSSSYTNSEINGTNIKFLRRSQDYQNSISFNLRIRGDTLNQVSEFDMRLRFLDDSMYIRDLEKYSSMWITDFSEFQFLPETGELSFVFSDTVKVPFEDITYSFYGDAKVKLFKLAE